MAELREEGIRETGETEEILASTKPLAASPAADRIAQALVGAVAWVSAQDVPSRRFQAKKEEVTTLWSRQNPTTERPLARCRSTISRHFRHAGDSALLMAGKADKCRSMGEDGVHLSLTFNDPDFKGCMFMNAAAEFPNPYDPIHQAASARNKRARRDLALSAGATPSAAETFADGFTALLEGALMLRQTQGRNDAARVIRPVVEQLIRVYLLQ